ncbi:Translation termination inhibitor protein ITT1 [Pseudozyma hubeiensis]|nr:Translation termination inhibitor protein ITT1 [Pseudozyma hubeiensis]
MQSQALLEECRQRQDDEIVALESIFAATEDGDAENAAHRPAEPRVKLISDTPDPVLELFLPVTLPRPARITVETFAHDTDACSATASSSKLPLESSVASNSPSVEQREKAAPSSHSNNGRRRSRKQATKSGHLDATAAAFSPSESVKLVPAVQLQAGAATEEEFARALDSLSLRSESTHDKATHDEPLAARLRSTQHLPPLRHLPPILLRVKLPPTYPAEKPPVVESLTAPWLQTRPGSQDASLSWLLQRLDEQYQELSGTEVLYTWATYLTENIWIALLEEQPLALDAPPFLRLAESASDTTQTSLRFEESLSSPEAQPLLAAQLVAHSRLCSRTTFDAASFDCAICLETRKGKACTRLTGCGHVFCSECLAGYLTSLVDDGFHRQAKRCPDPDCVTLWSQREKDNLVDQEGNLIASAKTKSKSNGAAVPNDKSDVVDGEDKAVVGLVTRSELEAILGTARLKRLDELTVKAKMEADPSVSYCPRSGCQAPVVRLSSDENSGHWERFRECLSCGFAFCAWCSRSWHGPTSCPVSFQSELIRRYLSLAESSHDRVLMEQKFGRKTLETMVRKYEEEQQTQQWLSDFTTPCPTCGIAIEKSYGCNHMTCKSCQTHYCYLCGKPISSQNPYQHFNTPGYECYHRLFDGLLGDQAPQHQGEQGNADARRGQGDGVAGNDARPGFALLLDENGVPLHLEPEDQEMDLLAWQQLG